MPLDLFAAMLPGAVRTEGNAKLSFRMGAEETGLHLEADLAGARLRVGDYVEKKPGDALGVAVKYRQAPDYALESATVTLLGESAELQLAGAVPGIPALNVNLAGLSPLLAKGGSLSGRVTGAVDLSPFKAKLQLDGAGIAPAPEVAINSVTGQVAYEAGALRCESLRVLGADSDCTADATLQNQVLDARVTGQKLNLNAVTALYDAFTAPPEGTASSAAAPALPPGAPAQRITGRVSVQLESLLYRRARAEALRADAALTPQGIDIHNLALRQGAGSAQGAVHLAYGTPNVLETSLKLSGLDLEFIDGLAFAESRGMRGAVTGPVNLRVPLASGDTLYRGLNGTVDARAENGTYGRVRYATELLTVLKGLEIVRLKMPRLRDEGLTFKTSTLKLRITDGRIAVEEFSVEDPAYAMAGGGTIDLPADAMDVMIGFNPLESVTGLVKVVPGVGQALDLLKDGTGLRIRASGSPFSPTVRPEAGLLPVGTEPSKGLRGVENVVKELIKPLR